MCIRDRYSTETGYIVIGVGITDEDFIMVLMVEIDFELAVAVLAEKDIQCDTSDS